LAATNPLLLPMRSDDKVFGWGGGGGYIYQKAYVEAFVSPDNLSTIIEEVSGR